MMGQFSFYINKNAEDLRKKFVNFKGQETLTVVSSESPNQFVKLLIDMIDKNVTDPELKKWIMPSFSTTTDNDIVTVGVIFMAAMKKYFQYCVMKCGITNVTLEGTAEDWKTLLGKLEKLKEYKLEKWYDLLKPVIQQFVDAKEGKVDRDFWQKICHHQAMSGSSYLSGWITVFCAFDKEGNWIESKWNEKKDLQHLRQWPRIDMDDVPTGLVDVNMLIGNREAVLMAGHMGVEVKEDGVTIQPVSGWALGLKPLKKKTNNAEQPAKRLKK